MPLAGTNVKEPPKPRHCRTLKWDSKHVRLPSAPQSQYPVKGEDGSVKLEQRWHLVEMALLCPILTSRDLERAILSYNTKYEKIWKFTALHRLFERELDEDESAAFFNNTLPEIIRLALRMPDLIQSAVPLLKQEENASISMTQEQIACLLANAFLCTYPRRNTKKRNSEYYTFPDINFNRLFQSVDQNVIEKLKCICNYFRRVCKSSNPPTGVITFSRRHFNEQQFPNWDDCKTPISASSLHITSDGTIESNGIGMLQVDFANKFIGGGVLGHGCVQEEIRFVICPELIVTRLFTEALKPTEALFIIGCEQFNDYLGYASTFTWRDNHIDETPCDEWRRKKCHIVAIDALHFTQREHQYRKELMVRELKKAYVGYYIPPNKSYPIASGNWGCGAFNGEANLKFLLQLMVCAVVRRSLVYFTFDDDEFRDSADEMYTFLCTNRITVCELWTHLKLFKSQELHPNRLFTFIYKNHWKTVNQIRKSQTTVSQGVLINQIITNPQAESIIREELVDNSNSSSSSLSVKKSIGTTLMNFLQKPQKLIRSGPSTSSLLSSLDEHYNSPAPKKQQRDYSPPLSPPLPSKTLSDEKMETETENTQQSTDSVVIDIMSSDEMETITQPIIDSGIVIDENLGEVVPGSPTAIKKSATSKVESSSPTTNTTPNRQKTIKNFFAVKEK